MALSRRPTSDTTTHWDPARELLPRSAREGVDAAREPRRRAARWRSLDRRAPCPHHGQSGCGHPRGGRGARRGWPARARERLRRRLLRRGRGTGRRGRAGRGGLPRERVRCVGASGDGGRRPRPSRARALGGRARERRRCVPAAPSGREARRARRRGIGPPVGAVDPRRRRGGRTAALPRPRGRLGPGEPRGAGTGSPGRPRRGDPASRPSPGRPARAGVPRPRRPRRGVRAGALRPAGRCPRYSSRQASDSGTRRSTRRSPRSLAR